MSDKSRLRRPPFDREAGVAIAQSLFHQRGYDAVSIADLTQALDIKPPSFYAAYESKAKLFERTLQRYSLENRLPLDKILSPDKSVAESIESLLVAAARQYGRHAQQRGCMVIEGMRADDSVARQIACDMAQPGNKMILAWLKSVCPEAAESLADFIMITLRGLSSAAHLGMSQRRLIQVARMSAGAAGIALAEKAEQPENIEQ